jgi:hypothetical protein
MYRRLCPPAHRFAGGFAQQGHHRCVFSLRDLGKRRQHRSVFREALPALGLGELIGHKRLIQPLGYRRKKSSSRTAHYVHL